MQGKKQSNAEKQREIGTLRWPPGQTPWLAGHVLWPPGPGQIHSGPYVSRMYVVMLGHAIMVGKL
jgi:hypothetical protein